MQVPEVPSFSVVYDIPTDNYSQHVAYYSMYDDRGAAMAITKIVVDNEVFYVNPHPNFTSGAGLSISSFTFASSGEHIVDIYTLPTFTIDYVLGYTTSADYEEVLPNTKKITISKPEYLSRIYKAFDGAL